MSLFITFQEAVNKQFTKMKTHDLFRVDLDKDKLYQHYLNSFPEGTNPMFRERTHHDCSCCKNFIRQAGCMVAIIDGKIQSIWDTEEIGNFYDEVAKSMSDYIHKKSIDNIYLHTEKNIGIKQTFEQKDDGKALTWNHFYLTLPNERVVKKANIGPRMADAQSTRDVFRRSLQEITDDAIETVLDLISQNSLYRGEEHQFAVKEFAKLKADFAKCKSRSSKDVFFWSKLKAAPQSVTRIRNTVIGTLLVDLSEGVDLEVAVKSFETKVAPTNYKRPTALITKAMIEKAQEKIEELGLTSALERRHATLLDVSISNLLFTHRKAKKNLTGNVFDELKAKVADKAPKNLDKIEEVTIDKFIADILPKAESIEVMMENRHSGNLVSLIAPQDKDAKRLFKWNNPFSWAYAGEVTDSIKQRVKAAGGKIDGDLRCSLSWYNFDDLDLHMREPGGQTIYYANKRSQTTGGMLDVDMNAGGEHTRNAVENIVYAERRNMREGIYTLMVNNFSRRESVDVGFEVEIEFDGQVFNIGHPKMLRDRGTVEVATIEYSHKNGFKLIESLPASQTSKEVWGVQTQKFHKVNAMMLSPNYWDGKEVGNKHYFFMLENCVNEEKPRGFFNEFLTEELNTHRKVFEVVGSKTKAEPTPDQLSGLGFSSTQRNSVLCKVNGSFSRTVKINF